MNEMISALLAAAVSLSVSEYSRFENIDNTKVAYGMGVDTDSLNRPLGAVQAQEQYGDKGGLFIGTAAGSSSG